MILIVVAIVIVSFLLGRFVQGIRIRREKRKLDALSRQRIECLNTVKLNKAELSRIKLNK